MQHSAMPVQLWLHIFSFYKDAPTCSKYPGYQQILPSFQHMLMSGFGLNSIVDFLVLMGSLKVFLLCKVTKDLGSTDSSAS